MVSTFFFRGNTPPFPGFDPELLAFSSSSSPHTELGVGVPTFLFSRPFLLSHASASAGPPLPSFPPPAQTLSFPLLPLTLATPQQPRPWVVMSL